MRVKLFIALLFIGLTSHAAQKLENIQHSFQDDHFIAEFNFGATIDVDGIAIESDTNGVYFLLPEVALASDKNLVRVSQNGIKSILTTISSTNMVRTKIFFEDGIDPKTMLNSVQLLHTSTGLKVIVKKPEAHWSNAVLGLPDFKPQVLTVNEILEIDMGAVVEAPAVAKTAEATTVKVSSKADKMGSAGISPKESEIPVLIKPETKKAEGQGTVFRLIMSFAIIIASGFGLIAFGKWYQKRGKKDIGNNQIRILAQHFLGPRKTLAIVRVAGETILIGVTDQNISMLKSLSLIDDEIPESMPQSFKGEMSTQMSQFEDTENQQDEEFVMSNVKNKLNAKLKNMRPLA